MSYIVSVWPSYYPFDGRSLVSLIAGGVLAALLLLGMRALMRCTWSPCQRMRCRCQSCIGISYDDGETSGPLLSKNVRRSDEREPAAGAVSRRLTPFSRSTFASTSGMTHNPSPHFSLQGKVVLVTGGSKGIGRAIVEEFLSQGCEVLTCARDITPLEELTSREPRCVAVQADVSTTAGRELLLKTLKRRFAFTLDVLVNNVGTNLRKPSERYTEDEYDELCATNQGSAFHLTRLCFDALRPRQGCVVNISSVSGSTVDSTGAPYHMNKAALEHMTRYLACEWGEHGIRVNAVAPWFIQTPLTAPLLADKRFHDAVRRATPMRRVGEVHEVACVVAFLAMPAAGYISGQVVGIDGAMMQEGFKFVR